MGVKEALQNSLGGSIEKVSGEVVESSMPIVNTTIINNVVPTFSGQDTQGVPVDRKRAEATKIVVLTVTMLKGYWKIFLISFIVGLAVALLGLAFGPVAGLGPIVGIIINTMGVIRLSALKISATALRQMSQETYMLDVASSATKLAKKVKTFQLLVVLLAITMVGTFVFVPLAFLSGVIVFFVSIGVITIFLNSMSLGKKCSKALTMPESPQA